MPQQPLPAAELPPVPNVDVHILGPTFDLAVPDIIMWGLVLASVLLFSQLRLPSWFEPKN